MRVLIVDDSVVMRIIVERALHEAALGVGKATQAANGEEGLAALEQAATANAPFDLILSDVHMPVMNGLTFLSEIRRRNLAPGVPVVMITADAADPDVQRAIDAGATGFISKPFTIEQMISSVAPLLPCAV